MHYICPIVFNKINNRLSYVQTLATSSSKKLALGSFIQKIQ